MYKVIYFATNKEPLKDSNSSASEPKKGTLPFISVQHTPCSIQSFVETLSDVVSNLSFQNKVVPWNFSWLDT